MESKNFRGILVTAGKRTVPRTKKEKVTGEMGFEPCSPT